MSTRNRPEKVIAAVDSILRSTSAPFEFVLVDQSDHSDTLDVVTPFLADPRFRHLPSNGRGLGRGRNLGIRATSAPIIVITDDDCIIEPSWIERMACFFDDASTGMVFCNVIPTEPCSAGHTPQIDYERTLVLATPKDGWESSRERAVLGAGMAIRRTMFEQLGGFDEMLGAGGEFPSCEDNDLVWRALDAGWQVRMTPDLVVHHDGLRSVEELRDLIRRDCLGAGGALAKYARRRTRSVAPYLLSTIVRYGIVEPVRELAARRRPRSPRRLIWILEGMFRGLRLTVDPITLRYVPEIGAGDEDDLPTGPRAPRS